MAEKTAVRGINTQEITDKARRELLQLLEAVRGKKNLVIERSLAGTVGLIVKFSTLQEYGVDKPFFLENHNIDASQRNIVFMVRGENAKKIRTVAEQIKLVRSESKIDHDFTIIWVPRRTLVSNIILEEHGVLGEANITQLDLNFIPLEPDLLSLELDDAFQDLYARKDPTCIFASAKALMLMQKQYGLFPRILGKGDNAKKLADLLIRMRQEEEVNAATDPENTYLDSFGLTPSALIENLVIIDREVDFATLLSTQLTYEGLLDETFSIASNSADINSSILGDAPTQPAAQNGSTPATTTTGTTRKVMLDSSDKLYPSLRDANFATIGPSLNRIARRLAAESETMRNPDQGITDLRNVVSMLPNYKAESASLKIHTSLAEEIMKTTRSEPFARLLEIQQNLLAGADPTSLTDNFDDLLARSDTTTSPTSPTNPSLLTALRLLSLASTTTNGLRPRDLEHFQRALLTTFGFQHTTTLSRLDAAGLLVPRDRHRGYLAPIAGAAGHGATDWSAVRRAWRLWTDEVREADPTDVAYVFSGYAPLSVRLVQAVVQKGLLAGMRNGGGGGEKSGEKALSLSPAAPMANAGNAAGSGNAQAGWKGFEDVLARIRGATVDVVQKGADAEASMARKVLRGSKEGPKVTVVFFLGGVTYAEVAALRFVSKQIEEASGRKIVIATTGVVNGRKVMEGIVEKKSFGG